MREMMPLPLGGCSLVQGVLCGKCSADWISLPCGWVPLCRTHLGWASLTVSGHWSVKVLLGKNLSPPPPPWHFSVSNCVGKNNHHPEFHFGEETCLKLHGHKRAELGFEFLPIKWLSVALHHPLATQSVAWGPAVSASLGSFKRYRISGSGPDL